MAGTIGSIAFATTATPRCLVLAAAEASLPVDLLEGVSRRGMAVAVVSDAPAVMADLGVHGAAAVVLVEPASLDHSDALVAAIGRYFPATTLWAFEPTGERGSAGRLTRLSADGHAVAPAPLTHHHDVGSTAVQADHEPAADESDQPPTSPRNRRLRELVVQVPPGTEHDPLITPEELEMLLDHAADPEEVVSASVGSSSSAASDERERSA